MDIRSFISLTSLFVVLNSRMHFPFLSFKLLNPLGLMVPSHEKRELCCYSPCAQPWRTRIPMTALIPVVLKTGKKWSLSTQSSLGLMKWLLSKGCIKWIILKSPFLPQSAIITSAECWTVISHNGTFWGKRCWKQWWFRSDHQPIWS